MNYLLLLLFALVTSCIYAKEVPNGDVASAARLASSSASSSVIPSVLPSASPLQLNYVPLDKIKNHSPLIIGETHGTQEVLLFLAKLIKSAQTKSESMAVLLELPADLNPLIDQYLKGQLAQPALMRHPFGVEKFKTDEVARPLWISLGM
ncbi:hypothetical protein [Pseudoalteromonas sp. T1lg48]|uniref:hypothetical protein n=1 Tax=Pseudoalteromonas sp. T1lg48 TaxID=2077100 RepID=UPI000CF6AA6A|nr:hypothetical protein [Pseudoalteromonas sp. T1lg48]